MPVSSRAPNKNDWNQTARPILFNQSPNKIQSEIYIRLTSFDRVIYTELIKQFSSLGKKGSRDTAYSKLAKADNEERWP